MAFTMTPSSTTVSEGAGSVTFTITRSSSAGTERVYFSTVQNQGSTNSGDYTGLSDREVVFAAGVTRQDITVNLVNDSAAEGTETFGAVIENAGGTVLDSSTFTITDNDSVTPSTFTMTPSSTTVSEGAGSVTFTITRSSSAGTERVYFSTVQNQGATNSGDYTGLSDREVVFAAGVTRQDITVNLVNDSAAEGTETFGAVIENAGGTVLDSSTFTITDNDSVTPSTFTMTPSSTTVSEGAGSVTFTITRSSSAGTERVYFSTVQNQGSTNSGDYTGLSDREVVFAAGVTRQDITVNLVNDSAAEGTETFGAVIENAGGTVLDSSTFTITDNDSVTPSTFTMTPSLTTVSEGAGSVTFTITRSSSAGTERVYFSTVQNQGSTNSGDYTGLSDREVVFAAGVTRQDVTVNLVNDSAAEGTETFGAVIENAGGTVLDSSTFTITDNDSVTPSTFTMTPSSTTVSEGAGSVTFTITRSSSAGTERVYFSTVQNQGATNSGDYAGLSDREVVFAAGVTRQDVTVNLVNDSAVEGTETFGAVIENAGGTVLDSSTFTITDNDSVTPSTFTMTPSSTTVSEGAGSVTFTITRSSSAGTERVYFSTVQNQGSTNSGDYAGLSDREVVFAAGVTRQDVTVNLVNDSVAEGTETFGAVIENAGGTVLDSSTFTIADNDINSAPKIGTATVTGALSELADKAVGENTLLHTKTGVIGFTDLNLSDVHTVSAVASATGYRGSLSASITDKATGDGTGAVTWKYTVRDSALDSMTAGQTDKETFRVTVDDGKGGSTYRYVTVTLTGAADITPNSAPKIGTATVTGALSELADKAVGENTLLHTKTGVISFTDLNLSDVHTVSAVASASGYRGSLSASITDKATGDGTGAVTWKYTVKDSALDSMTAGETDQETFRVTVDDGKGGSTYRYVTVTLTGAADVTPNSAPKIGTATVTGALSELADKAVGENTLLHSQTGVISFTDLNLSDVHTVSAVASATGYRGSLSASITDKATGDGTGAVTWKYTVKDSALDSMTAGEAEKETFRVTVDDGKGGSTYRYVTVTLTGAADVNPNSGPKIGTATVTGALSELADKAVGENTLLHTQTGVISFTDLNLSDVHTVSAVASASGYRGALSASITDKATGDGTGAVTWKYTVKDSALDSMTAGQTDKETFRVTIDDDKGGSTYRYVTVTLTGAADSVSSSGMKGTDLIVEALSHLGTEYIFGIRANYFDPDYGAKAQQGFDCAEFVTYCTYWAYNRMEIGLTDHNKTLATDQAYSGVTEAGKDSTELDGWYGYAQTSEAWGKLIVIDLAEAKDVPGAILMVKPNAEGRAGGHVAISMGDGKHVIDSNALGNTDKSMGLTGPGFDGAHTKDIGETAIRNFDWTNDSIYMAVKIAGVSYSGSVANNPAPTLTATGSDLLHKGLGETFSLKSLFSAQDSDGIAAYWFSDQTPGQGHLTLDGVRIRGDSVAVAASDVSRIGYNMGASLTGDGQNKIDVFAYDNNGRVSANLRLTFDASTGVGDAGQAAAPLPNISSQLESDLFLV